MAEDERIADQVGEQARGALEAGRAGEVRSDGRLSDRQHAMHFDVSLSISKGVGAGTYRRTPSNPHIFRCTFGDEFTHELKPSINTLRFNIVEHLPERRSRLIGKVQLRRKEAVQSPSQDTWLPIFGISGPKAFVSTVIAELCLDIVFEPKTKMLKIR